jgi:Family of unknown function (DUF5681)
MKFPPGQSGNPAGRPLGARNKKTIAMQAVFAATQDETAKMIVARAQGGNSTARRICAERTPPELELPPVRCAADAQKALDMVIEAFGRGEITVREFPCLLGAVDRMTRVVERIEAMSKREHERYKAQRVHGVHPSMIPKPTGEPDRMEAIMAAIERGEDPFPADPVKSAYVMNGEGLYRQMTEDGCQRTDFDGAASGLVSSDLYSPVNSEHAAEEESRRPTPCPKLPRSRGSPSPHAGVPSAASALELTGRYRPSASPIPPPFAAEGDAASAP